MPYVSEKIPLPECLDRRKKLSEADKDEIRRRYKGGGCSLNSLASEYNVSKKTILLTVNPDSMAVNKKRIKEHWRDYRPSKESWNATIREHRKYKQSLYLAGELKTE